jgi:hypothetical protein
MRPKADRFFSGIPRQEDPGQAAAAYRQKNNAEYRRQEREYVFPDKTPCPVPYISQI